ncbi:MAG: hypothetical protein IMW90_06055 [Thermogemmatispora sp.]|jgi:hypothetical protein|uniref:Uncharacterized protein n=1 Tax=Thermogemmatispora aurantia TaxID=2045279 RepID=A0A5J4KAB9_9CHLR|nr:MULTISPECIES: hypothetical protein [Thermogemmatispora]MBE3565275.1 hypothetical protein [Thermogemmatispora sp.]GER83086.1 hypothetical protein KTAU_17230 [Thermogemmatispora aurantia]
MNFSLLNKLVQAAKRDGLTLQWSLIHLLDRLERYEQRLGYLRYRDGDSDESEAQQLRLDNEALALVLLAVLKAYPAGADIALEEPRLPELASLLSELAPERRDGQAREKRERC